MGMNRFIGLALVSVVTWMGVSYVTRAAELSAEEYAARAVQSVKEGKQAEAQADFDKAVELAPDKPIHYRNRAAFFSLTKQWAKAIADYDHVLKLEKNDPAIELNRGYAYVELGKLGQALDDFNAVLKIQPDSDRALRFRAYTYAAQKQDAKAVADL